MERRFYSRLICSMLIIWLMMKSTTQLRIIIFRLQFFSLMLVSSSISTHTSEKVYCVQNTIHFPKPVIYVAVRTLETPTRQILKLLSYFNHGCIHKIYTNTWYPSIKLISLLWMPSKLLIIVTFYFCVLNILVNKTST